MCPLQMHYHHQNHLYLQLQYCKVVKKVGTRRPKRKQDDLYDQFEEVVPNYADGDGETDKYFEGADDEDEEGGGGGDGVVA